MRRLQACVVLGSLVLGALLLACGEPRKEANAGVRPAGSGWFCWRNTHTANASRCMRTKEECDISRKGARSANGKIETSAETFTECEPTPSSGCFTSVSAKNSAESFTCSRSLDDCESLRRNLERDPDKSGNYASISSCAQWD